jgi:hypothetical protein
VLVGVRFHQFQFQRLGEFGHCSSSILHTTPATYLKLSHTVGNPAVPSGVYAIVRLTRA